MNKFLEGFNFAGFRRMFYLIHPNETSYENLEAIPWFTIFIALEICYAVYKDKKEYYRANDAITSIGAGVIEQSLRLLMRGADFKLCCWVYENYAIIHLPWNSAWTWIIAFLFVDFTYYWFHRAAHEVNFMWAFHQVHHSSEDYNLSTSLRLGMFQQYIAMFFNLPQSLILPPSAHYVHLSMCLIYQFWIHTQAIGTLGPLDLLINTPSNHRVHHGRNPYCIDKNYGSTLIIWDRMFGTYQREKPEEPVVFGLTENVKTFDPLFCQLFYFKQVFIDKWSSMTNFNDKLKAIFYGPGWHPGVPRSGDINEIPQIEYPVVKYNLLTPIWILIYVVAHFVVIYGLYIVFSSQRETLLFFDALTYFSFIVYSLKCFGAFFDNKFYAAYLELIRCFFMHWWLFPKITPGTYFQLAMQFFLSGSSILWVVKILSTPNVVFHKKLT